MNNPDVSIVITNYNYEKFLARCIRSCVNQRNVSHEIIIVDDCSDIAPTDVISTFCDNVRYFQTPANSGVAAAANVGIKNARGQFIIRVDADDYVNADMCHFLKTYLESNHDAFCVSCDYFLIDDHENVLERKHAELDNISCGIMYRRDLLVEMGGYNDSFRHREEEELRKRLGNFYKIHHLKIPLYRYRMHNDNKTKTKEYRTTKV